MNKGEEGKGIIPAPISGAIGVGADTWLRFSHIVSTAVTRSSGDRRRKVTRVIASYRCAAGYEYRKSFEAYGDPHIPQAGFNRALTVAGRLVVSHV